jgi:hypothetical protein
MIRRMMGNRAKLNGDEWDAFSRRSRRLLRWRSGEVKKIKRLFARKQRRRSLRAIKGSG